MAWPALLRRTTSVIAVAALAWPLAAVAGPVQGDTAAPDPYELALHWTLASLSTPGGRPATPELPPGATFTPVPPAGVPLSVPAGGVPDPGAYALMGLVLLAAGLAGRKWASRQRGLSKKT